MAVDGEAWAAAATRLRDLRDSGALTRSHVRLAAAGLGVAERTVWRRVAADVGKRGRALFVLSETDREALAYYRGNVAAVWRARQAVLTGAGGAAGSPAPEVLADGWAGAAPVGLRTLQKAFTREYTPAAQAALRRGEAARRAHEVYRRRPPVARNRVWELDHKQLPIVVLPGRGPACKPWLTSVVDTGTRALLGWAIALTPHAGTVLTALRMALVQDPDRGPFGAVPALVRVDRGLEFAASWVAPGLLEAPGPWEDGSRWERRLRIRPSCVSARWRWCSKRVRKAETTAVRFAVSGIGSG